MNQEETHTLPSTEAPSPADFFKDYKTSTGLETAASIFGRERGREVVIEQGMSSHGAMGGAHRPRGGAGGASRMGAGRGGNATAAVIKGPSLDRASLPRIASLYALQGDPSGWLQPAVDLVPPSSLGSRAFGSYSSTSLAARTSQN